MIYSSHKKNVIFAFTFLTLLYPLFHYLFIYSVIFFSKMFLGIESPYFNLVLLGWKEAALIFIGFLIIIKDTKKHLFILILFGLCTIFGTVRLIKEILLPFLALYLVYLNYENIKYLVERNANFILKFLILIIVISAIFGIFDLTYRSINNITPSNFSDVNYLKIINEIKCTKSAITSSLDVYDYCTVYTFPNFYKIFLEGDLFISKQILLMPAGDNVSMSYILLYSILFLIFIKNSNISLNKKYINLILFLLMILQIFTFNRVNVLTSLIIYVYYNMKNKNILMLMPILFLFFYYFNNLFFSIFDPRVPSNMGHIEGLKNIIPYTSNLRDFTMNELMIGLIVFILLILLFSKLRFTKITIYISLSIFTVILMRLFGSQISLFGTWATFPTESNYLKVIYSYGLIGISVYLLILTNIIYFLREKNFYLKILLINIFAYQFISPYVISGFVVFMPATIMIALFLKTKEELKIEKKNT